MSPTNELSTPTYSPDDVATMFHVTAQTLANWRSQGKGPDHICFGGRVRYLVRDVNAFVEGQRVRVLAKGAG